jgi:hypothetical protein
MTVDRLQDVGLGVVVFQITILVVWAVASALGVLRLRRRHADVRSTQSISTSEGIVRRSRRTRPDSMDVGTKVNGTPVCG